MEPTVAHAVSTAVGGGGVACTYGASSASDGSGGVFAGYAHLTDRTYMDQLAALMPTGTAVQLLDPAVPADDQVPAAAGPPDDGIFQVTRRPGHIHDLATITPPAGMSMVGALLDLRVADGTLENSDRAAPLDLRRDTSDANNLLPASEWLLGTSVSRLSWVLEHYASLHDPLLAARLAEVIVSRQRRWVPSSSACALFTQLCSRHTMHWRHRLFYGVWRSRGSTPYANIGELADDLAGGA
jgi:hypothetical protein